MPSRALAAVLFVACAAGACTNHDPVLGRVGPGPVPSQDAAAAGGTYPCAVQQVLKARCWRCHTNPPQNGAPFPLLTYSDTQQDYLLEPIWRRMIDAVSTDYMPFMGLKLDPPVQPLSADQKATLLGWLESGTPPDGGAAGAGGASGAAGAGGAGANDAAADASSAEAAAGAAGADAGDAGPTYYPPPPAGPNDVCP